MNHFRNVLDAHKLSTTRKKLSLKKLKNIQQKFSCDEFLKEKKQVCIFTAGSFGRLDSGEKSDLDIFVTADGDNDVCRLEEIELFASILRINKELDFPPLSNDGEYLKVFHVEKNKNRIGSPIDDKENWFTTRMLLLLESNYLHQQDAYNRHIHEVLNVYFRDAKEGHKPFKPLYLLNDILRFWRTLCLNYEQARHDTNRLWKKRNFNLRFSRMLTVFGTILPLILDQQISQIRFEQLTSLSPLERFVDGLDLLSEDTSSLRDRFGDFLDYYENFLEIKETQDFEKLTSEVRESLHSQSSFFSEFIFDALTHQSVPKEFKRYLVI